MIYVGNIKQHLMDILIKSGKPVDRDNTVPVKVYVDSDPNRKPYWTTVYKNPEEVAHDAKVLGNRHLLPKDHPQYKKQLAANAKTAVPFEVKQRVDQFVDQHFGNDRTKVYNFLRQNNISWTQTSNEGITYMRAKMALKSAVHNRGFDLENPQPITNVDLQALVTRKPQDIPKKPYLARVSDKARKIGSAYYASLNKDRETLYANLREWGITWDVSDNDGITCMRALNALNVAIDRGFDPMNPPTKPGINYVDPSAIVVPKDATPRQKNLIEHINKMTDIEAIEACTRMGVVPEDTRAQHFIMDRLQASLVNTLSKASAQVKQRIDQEWGKGVLSRLQAQLQDSMNGGKYINSPVGFGKQMGDVVALAGCKKNVVQEGFQTLANNFNMSILTNPRDTLATPIQKGSMGQNGGTYISSLIAGLNEGYSNHATDDHPPFQSNLGYSGYDPDVYAARFETDQGAHDGFSLYLDKIASDNAQDSTIQPVVTKLKQQYTELLNQCEGNPNLMNVVLSSNTWSGKPWSDYQPSSFGKAPLASKPQAVAAVRQMDKTYRIVIDELQKRGYSVNDIQNALNDTVHNDNLEEFHIGNDVINFREVKIANKPAFKKMECAWGTGSLLCAQAMFAGELKGDPQLEMTPPPAGCESAWSYYKAAKQIQNFTPEQYIEVHKLSHEMCGLSFTKDKQPLDYSTLDTIKPWKAQGISQTAGHTSPALDLVMTNLIMGHMHHNINTSIVQNITKNTQGQSNNYGVDYAGNFDYYSGTVMSAPSEKRFTQLGNNPGNGKTYTAAQLSDKITQQIKSVPNYSGDYISKVKTYYNNKGTSPMGESFAKFYNKGTDVIMENPIKDILFSVAQDISHNTPIMANKPRFDTQMAKRLDYVPFDFEHPTDKQPRFNAPKTKLPVESPPTSEVMLAARQKLLQAATCSLKTEDKATSQELQAKMSGPGFDYKDSNKLAMGEKEETNPNMNAPRRPLHSGNKVPPDKNRVLVFNSPFFKINNSVDEEAFNTNHASLTRNGVETLASKPLELYQGLTYSAAAGQLKQDQDVTANTDSSLGWGKHYSYKAGHAAGFVGDQQIRAAKVGTAVAARSPASGIMGMATVMRGAATSNQGASDLKKQLTSLSGDHRSQPPLTDYELCIKADGLGFTHHIVDVTVMNLGLTAQRTDNGIVKASTKELVADPNGTSINMTYKEDM